MNNRYINNFTYGRDLVKKLVIGAVICCALTLVFQASYVQIGFMVAGVGMLVAAIVVIVRDCRCPHCGKVIFLGVLAVKNCPNCKRNLVTGRKAKKKK